MLFVCACCFSWNKNSSDLLQFESFHKQLKHVNVDVFRRTQVDEDDITSAHHSHFYAELLAARHVTPYDDFIAFSRHVSPLALSLPLLLRNKDRVIGALVDWLGRADVFSRRAIVALVPHVARDLQDEFYPHFQAVFRVLVSLLDPTSAEVLGEIFTCLAFLLKFLRRPLLRNIDEVFDCFRELLDAPTQFVRDFAAQSFAFLLRKLEAGRVLPFVIRAFSLRDCSALLFFSARGFSGHLHSSSARMFTVWFDGLTVRLPSRSFFLAAAFC